jgi:hypothetical protein
VVAWAFVVGGGYLLTIVVWIAVRWWGRDQATPDSAIESIRRVLVDVGLQVREELGAWRVSRPGSHEELLLRPPREGEVLSLGQIRRLLEEKGLMGREDSMPPVLRDRGVDGPEVKPPGSAIASGCLGAWLGAIAAPVVVTLLATALVKGLSSDGRTPDEINGDLAAFVFSSGCISAIPGALFGLTLGLVLGRRAARTRVWP